MFTQIKTVHLDGYGREVATFHNVGESGVSIGNIVAALEQAGETVIEARYVR